MPKSVSSILWDGPEGRGRNGGITQSMIGRILNCKTRAAFAMIDGLRPPDTFNSVIEFGHEFHLCDEVHSGGGDWRAALHEYAVGLCRKYRTEQTDVDFWTRAVRTIFPEYLAYWSQHVDEQTRVPVAQEMVFDHDYVLPSGRVVRLRGKMDGVDLIGEGRAARVWLFETKTKGRVDRQEIEQQLSFDLQSMLYLNVLDALIRDGKPPFDKLPEAARTTPAGVRYNVVRRPFSGGEGSIRQRKPSKSNPDGESLEQFFERLRSEYVEPGRADWFLRWNAAVSPADLAEYRTQFLDPVLEQVCDWYSQVTGRPTKTPPGYRTPLHYRHPYGVRNVLDAGGSTEYDKLLATGAQTGLVRVDTLFGELA